MYSCGDERPSLPGRRRVILCSFAIGGWPLLRVLVLIGGLLIFRALLPQKTKRSTTTITPYMNGLDRMLSASQVSAVLDETGPYESWLASHRANVSTEARADDPLPNSSDESEYAICGAHPDAEGAPRGKQDS